MKNSIPIFKFKEFRGKEIPNDHNPCDDYINYSERIRRTDCLLLCKVPSPRHSGVGDGYVVLYIPRRGDFTRQGVFWKYENAELFINSLKISIDMGRDVLKTEKEEL